MELCFTRICQQGFKHWSPVMGTGQIILYVFYHTCVTCRVLFTLLSLVLGSKSRVSLVNTDICFYAEKIFMWERKKYLMWEQDSLSIWVGNNVTGVSNFSSYQQSISAISSVVQSYLLYFRYLSDRNDSCVRQNITAHEATRQGVIYLCIYLWQGLESDTKVMSGEYWQQRPQSVRIIFYLFVDFIQ